MKPPEGDPRTKLIGDWLAKADQDLRAAEAMLTMEPPLLFCSCFHAQQAVEKYLKALLTRWNIEIPKTHELGKLLKMIEARHAGLVGDLIDVVILNTYAVDTRYPGDQPEPSRQEAQGALELARRVRVSILPLLPPQAGFGVMSPA